MVRFILILAAVVACGVAWDPNCFKTLHHSFYDINELKR